ncbi:unnamed protein product [Durusdinium trenchii]|uniref:Uncharacterized protein n=1 Tax=Durusdinium trenchii TaxID=1381693 RepID=A0ABP0NKE2_9DINO
MLPLTLHIPSLKPKAIYGSFTPPVPAPMTQWHFEELIKLEPWVQEMQRLAGSPMPQNLQMVDAGDHLMEDVLTLQEEYLKEALALRPSWPGQRMDLAVQQMGLARKVFKEAVLFSYDLRSNDKQLQAAIGMFRDNHARLKDGGEAIPAIMLPERQDLMDQWELVDAAWNELLLHLGGELSPDGAGPEVGSGTHATVGLFSTSG